MRQTNILSASRRRWTRSVSLQSLAGQVVQPQLVGHRTGRGQVRARRLTLTRSPVAERPEPAVDARYQWPAGNSNFYDGIVRAFRALWTRDAHAEIVAVGNIAVAADAHIALRDVRPAIAAALDYRAANPHSLRYMAITREQALAWKAHPETIPDAVVRDTGVVGTPDDCVKRLEDLADLGITQFVLRFPDELTVRAFGQQVLPRIRARPT